MLRSLSTVGALTFMSRILGYFRELSIASFIGAGPLSDAFFLALKLPNLFRRLFAEGAFNAAFVPLFTGLLSTSKQKAMDFANHAFYSLSTVLILLVILFELFMPAIIHVLAPGFKAHAQKIETTIYFARITFPYIFFISLASLLSGILNSMEKFGAATAAPILLNANAILALLLFNSTAFSAASALTWSVPLSGILQLMWVFYASQREGFSLKPMPRKNKKLIKTLYKKMLPGLFGGGVYQFNMLVSDIIASFIPMAISYLSFADRINQFPLSIIGVSMGVVLLPMLSKAVAAEDDKAAHRLQEKAIRIALFLSIPAAAALYYLAFPVIDVLYHHGRFTLEAVQATSTCLSAYVLGLPAYVLAKVFSAPFFARGDTKTPVIIGSITLLLNIGFSLILVPYFSYQGIALASAASYWVNCIALCSLLLKQKRLTISPTLMVKMILILLNTTLMLGILHLSTKWLGSGAPNLSLMLLTAVIGIGLLTYILGGYFLRIFSPQDFKKS